MDPSDLASLLFSSDEEGPAKAQAYAQALRGQQQLGLLGQLTGDKVLGGVGNQLLRSTGQGQELMQKVADLRLQRSMEAQKAKTEQEFRQSQERHMTQQEAIARQQLAQGKYVQGQWGVLNTKTGAVDPYVKAPKEASPAESEKEWKGFTDAISTSHGRSNINVDQQKRLYAGDRIKAIALDPNGNLMDLPPSQMAELASMSAALAQGSAPTQHSIEAMTPSSVGSDAAKLQQWLTNAPAGAGQKQFVKMLVDQAKREEDVIKPQILSAQLQAVPNYVHLKRKDQARFESLLKANGIDPGMLDDNGLRRAVQAATEGGGGDSNGIFLDSGKAARLLELRKLAAARAAGQAK